jgi:hypothetical protein
MCVGFEDRGTCRVRVCGFWELRAGNKGTWASCEVPRCPRVILFFLIIFNFILNPLGFNDLKHFFFFI